MFENEFEKILKKALVNDIEKEYDSFSNDGIILPEHTAQYLRFEKKILKNPMEYANKASGSAWKNIAKRVAIVIITFAVIFGIMMSIPTVRAYVFGKIEKFADHYEHTTDAGDVNQVIGECNIAYLPEGFEVVFDNGKGFVECSDGKSNIALQYDYVCDSMGISINNEDVNERNITIGGHNAFIYERTTEDEQNVIIWYDEGEMVFFVLISDIEVEEMIKVAESVSLK